MRAPVDSGGVTRSEEENYVGTESSNVGTKSNYVGTESNNIGTKSKKCQYRKINVNTREYVMLVTWNKVCQRV